MAGKGRIENLRPWKKGQSGNLSGRPKKKPITEAYERQLKQSLPDDFRIRMKLPEGATWADAVAVGQIRSAVKGNTQAAKEIADRLEGKVAQQLETAKTEGKPLSIEDLDTQKVYRCISAIIGVGLPMEYRVEPDEDEATKLEAPHTRDE